PVVALTDDSLLRELAEDGRLTGLVRAADEAFDGAGGRDLRRAVCLAVDPDLLGTVSEVADGRTVLIGDGSGRSDGGGSSTRTRGERDDTEWSGPEDPGAVAADARRWLDELRALAEGGCVVGLPAAQAGLEAVG